MELFALHCTTCKARLKVTDASLVGQILSCPKCHSMVMVEPPPNERSGRVAAAAPRGTKEVSAGTSSIVIQSPVASLRTAVTPPPLPGPPPLPTVSSKATGCDVAVGTASVPATRQPRDLWLLAGGIAAGAAMGVAIWILIVPRGPANGPVVAASANAAHWEMAAEESPRAAEPASAAVESAAEPAARSDALQAVAQEVPPPAIEPMVETLVGRAVQDNPVQPPRLPAASDQPQAAIPGNLGAPPSPEPEPSPPAVTAPQEDEIISRLRGRLLKGVAFEKAPLRQFTAFVSDYSGVKITIDAESLRAAGIKAPTVTVHETDVFIDKVLQSVLDELGLTFESRDGAIVIFAN